MALTQDRASYTAAQLNTKWSELVSSAASALTEDSRYNACGQFFDDYMTLDESDSVSAQIETYDDLLYALAYKTNAFYAETCFDQVGTYESKIEEVPDGITFGIRYFQEKLPPPNQYQSIFDFKINETDLYLQWQSQIQEEIDRAFNFVDQLDWGQIVRDDGTGQFNNLYNFTYDIKVQESLVEQMVDISSQVNMVDVQTKTQVSPVQVQNSQPINSQPISNTYKNFATQSVALISSNVALQSNLNLRANNLFIMQTSTAFQGLKPTINTGQSIINTSNITNSVKLSKYKFGQLSNIQQSAPIFNLVYTKSTTNFTTSRVVDNSLPEGWFGTGYLGTERFDDSGYNSWFPGTKTKISEVDFSGTGFSEWYSGKSYDIDAGDVEEFDDWTPVITVLASSCGSRTRTANITSQINGVTDTFIMPEPYQAGSLHIYINGQRDTVTELTSTTFQMDSIPIIGDSLYVDYEP